MGKHRLRNCSAVLCIMALIALVICAATHFWYITEIKQGVYINEGLWISCQQQNCYKIGSKADLASWFIAVRALLLIAIALIIGVIAALGISLKYSKWKITYPLSITFMCIVGFVALTLYAAHKKTIGETKYVVSFGYSYIIGWASIALSMVAAVMAWLDVYQKTS